MRITLVQGAFLPVPALRGGAVEKIWHRLGIEFAARGHEVTHISRLCDGLAVSETAQGVRHLRVAGFNQPSGAVRLKCLDFIYSLRACRRLPKSDVIVTNTFWSPLLLGARRGAVCVDVQRLPKGQMRLYRSAARLRACSSAVRDAIVREYPKAASRVRVIPNPLPFVPGKVVSWDQKQRVILYAGRLHPEKGIELLLAAFARAKSGHGLAGWRLELVGPGDTAFGGGGISWLSAMRRRHPHPDIAWLPAVFDIGELNGIYARASVFAYPSLAEGGETFGLAVLEAMAWGAAPVVSDLPAFRDFVDSGVNGVVFDHRCAGAAASLANALADAAASARMMGERSLNVRTTHASGAIADRFLADFATLCR